MEDTAEDDDDDDDSRRDQRPRPFRRTATPQGLCDNNTDVRIIMDEYRAGQDGKSLVERYDDRDDGDDYGHDITTMRPRI